jgi:hypothetical protein
MSPCDFEGAVDQTRAGTTRTTVLTTARMIVVLAAGEPLLQQAGRRQPLPQRRVELGVE